MYKETTQIKLLIALYVKIKYTKKCDHVKTECGHRFHVMCYMRLMYSEPLEPSCPNCRADINTTAYITADQKHKIDDIFDISTY